MPDPGVQRSGEGVRSIDDRRDDFRVAESQGPLGTLGIDPVARVALGALIPGIGIMDTAHGVAKAVGGTIRDILESLGLEGTAPAMETGVIENDRDGANRTMLAGLSGSSSGSSRTQTAGLGTAAGLFAGSGLAAIGQARNALEAPAQIEFSAAAPDKGATGIGNKIIEQAGIEKLNELFTGEGEKSEAEKSSPTQAVDKPVQSAQQSRDEGRSDFEKLFLKMLTGKLEV